MTFAAHIRNGAVGCPVTAAMAADYEAGLSVRQVAHRHGKSYAVTHRRLHAAGVRMRHRPATLPAEVADITRERILDLLDEQKMLSRELARRTGVTAGYLSGALSGRYGLTADLAGRMLTALGEAPDGPVAS